MLDHPAPRLITMPKSWSVLVTLINHGNLNLARRGVLSLLGGKGLIGLKGGGELTYSAFLIIKSRTGLIGKFDNKNLDWLVSVDEIDPFR